MINAQELQGQWNKIRGQVKEKWGQLTEDDLAISGGNIDQLVGRIQRKTGEGREVIEKYLNDLLSHGSSAVSGAVETARDYASRAGERIRDGYSQFSDQSRETYDHAEDLVRQNPATSVVTAFGIGLAVGVIFGIALRSR